jgi:hypothetical protein
MWSFWFFSRNFTRSTVLKFWGKTPVKKNNSSSLIITSMELRFEPCVRNLIWKWGAKDPKKRDDHLIFINFGVKKFTLRNTQKLFFFDVWMLLSPSSHGMRSCNFFRLIYSKVTSRSYNYFLKFSYLNFLRNWFFQLCQKLQRFGQKNTRNFRG